MLGGLIAQFLLELTEGAQVSSEYQVHFVTAREMVNIILAACDRHRGMLTSEGLPLSSVPWGPWPSSKGAGRGCSSWHTHMAFRPTSQTCWGESAARGLAIARPAAACDHLYTVTGVEERLLPEVSVATALIVCAPDPIGLVFQLTEPEQ